MQPCFHQGDYILVSLRIKKLGVGEDIVCMHPHFGLMLKRIINIQSDGFNISGLNSLSTSQEILGKIHKEDVIGRVIWKFKKINNR